jgi:predicted phage-related endonuclease
MTLSKKQIAERVGAITGTRAAIIEGTNRFDGDLYSLWSVMTGRSNDKITPSLMMRLGHYTEPGNVAEYELKTGRKCRQVHRTIRHKKHDRLRGHPDRLIVGSANHGLECKAVFQRSESDWDNGVPYYYLSQVKHYALITGRMRWDFSVLFLAYGRHKIYELEFTKQDTDELLEKELAFLKMVDEDTAPEVTARSTDALKQEWKTTDPELIKVADDMTHYYVMERRKLKSSIDTYKDQLDLCENKIRQRMEDGETLIDSNGDTLATYKLGKSGSRRFNFNIKKEKKNADQPSGKVGVGEAVPA